MHLVAREPAFDVIRGNPRFIDIARRIGPEAGASAVRLDCHPEERSDEGAGRVAHRTEPVRGGHERHRSRSLASLGMTLC